MEVTDKLICYEAHLERQLYRAMDQLERLQRLRGGEWRRGCAASAQRQFGPEKANFAKRSQ
jgi:hypothetical protein